MSHTNFCQSCSLPLSDESLLGTEKDGSKSQEYCKFCYQHGAFTDPGMTLEKMRSRVIGKTEGEEVPADIIEAAVARLPLLKRWKNETRIADAEKVSH